ncbi:MAG: Transcription factor TFIIIB component B [Thelocarpon impressellum]|nr:MAG: Transcription factor TFIIIB component B [Thelocarpon impressellum]
MSTFASSVINKSSKKIAPKAVAQRRRAAAPTPGQSSARASVERQAPSQTAPSSIVEPVSVPGEARDQDPQPLDDPISDGPSKGVLPVFPTPPPTEPVVADSIDAGVRSASETPQDAALRAALQRESSAAPAAALESRQTRQSTASVEPPSKRRRVVASLGKGRASRRVPVPRVDSEPLATRLRSGTVTNQDLGVVIDPSLRRDVTVEPSVESNETQPPAAKKKRKAPVKRKTSAQTTTTTDTGTAIPESERPRVSTRKTRRKEATPELNETVEIAPTLVKMSDLCRDLRTGKKSKREKELQALDWTAVIHKQKERQARRARGSLPPPETVDEMLARAEREQEPTRRGGFAAPQMRVVNGKIVVDDASLQVDRHAVAEAEAETMEEIVENELTRRVTSGSWMKRSKKEAWDEAATDLFYEGLRTFGTDFQIISRMVPGMTRRHIKNKFAKEERLHPGRVTLALTGPKEPMDLEAYSRHTGTDYEDVAAFEAELEREAAAHAAAEARMAEEAAQLQQQRRDAPAASGTEDAPTADPAAKENGGAAATTAPTTGKAVVGAGKRTRKAPVASPRKQKKKMHSRHGGGEEVEVLGSIEDIQQMQAHSIDGDGDGA